MNGRYKRVLNAPANISRRNLSRDEFFTPLDDVFDVMINNMFPMISRDLGEGFFNKGSYPKVNVINKSSELLIEAATPGMEKEDVKVQITDGVLSISGDKNQHNDVSEGQFLKREIKRSSFKRSFKLSDNLKKSEISASYTNGILSLVIPKITKDDSPTKPIDISIS